MNENEIFKLSHVSKTFQSKAGEVKAVDDVSLSIQKGEIFGVIGMSGAGKSTLVRTLNRLERVTKGNVYFQGEDLENVSAKKLREVRRSIGMIFQGFHLLMQKNVLDNIILPLKIAGVGREERKKRAYEMLRLVDLESKARTYPAQLSGGQKQRVAIARALALNPAVLLCDEATSALDPKITDEILKLLKDINKKMDLTVVIITHEMSVVEKICDRVAIIEHGKLAEIGAVEDIFTNPRTEAARRLVYPGRQDVNPFDMTDRHCIRIAFDGRAASEPLIANLVEETGEKVNILCANTKTVKGVGFGQMIVELPYEREAEEKVLHFLKSKGVSVSQIDNRKEGESL